MNIPENLSREKSVIVKEEMSAAKMGSGLLPVFATPMMIALMENVCAEAVETFLDEGCTTVGINVNVNHVSATPIGCEVSVSCELTEIEGKILTFKVSARDNCGLIGEGTHRRAIVTAARFMEKTEKKRV